MRLLHVLAPAPCGGLEGVVQSLTRGLAARGHQVHVAVVVDPGEAAGHPFVEGLSTESHLVPAAPRAYHRERAAVAALAARLSPDVLHTHGYRPDLVHAGWPAVRLPRVSTVHGFTGGGARMRLYEALQRRALARLEGVVAVARPLAARLSRTVRPERLHTIPNAWCGAAPAAADARERLGVSRDVFHIGWVGRLSREKGPDVLLDALPMLDGAWTTSFLGDGPERDSLELRARQLGISGRVRWHGMVPAAASLLHAFDVLVLSSRTEGTPLVVIEAAAAGVPIVACAVGGVPDMLSPAEAWLTAPESPVALAAALAQAAASPDVARERAGRARARLARELAPGPWLDAYERVYESVLRPAPRSYR